MTTSSPGDVPRSLAFYAVFYGGSVFLVLAALLAMALGTRLFRRTVDLWSRFHRLCMRGLLGIRVRVEGNLPEGQMLVAMKHESFFEAIDLPVCGDPVYGVALDLGLERQFLHADRLSFAHPFTGEPVALESPLPDDLAGALARARNAA